MQLILDTGPVVREEDRLDLLQVMPTYVSHGWKVKRSFRELIPEVEVEADGERDGGWRIRWSLCSLLNNNCFMLKIMNTRV